jgi:hypothetical protein
MTGRKRSHSESRWALLPPTVIRCNAARPDGSRCKREAEDGAVVCDQHGGAAHQVRRRAAERLIMTADQAAQMLVRMMEDSEVPFGVRAKIAQDLLDRAGLIATQVHQIVPTTDDPVMRFFEGAFSDPSNWESTTPHPDSTTAIESDAASTRGRHEAEPEEIVEADIVEPDGEPADDTPPRIAEMIKAGAFDRKAGE